MKDALLVQVGGSHYKDRAMQPIELITKTKCTFIQGCIWKYITRYKEKNGREDIQKCIHYSQLAIQLNDNGQLGYRKLGIVREYCKVNNLSKEQEAIILLTAYDSYQRVIDECEKLLKEYAE